MPAANDSSAVTLGVRFKSASDGFITGIRFYKGAGNVGTHTGALYKADGTVLSTVIFTMRLQQAGRQLFASAVPIVAGATYVAAYTSPEWTLRRGLPVLCVFGKTAVCADGLGGSERQRCLSRPGSGMPASSYQQTNYYVDVVYSPLTPRH